MNALLHESTEGEKDLPRYTISINIQLLTIVALLASSVTACGAKENTSVETMGESMSIQL